MAAGVSGDFAAHSLRRGFITNAAKKIPIENIKRVTGQRSSHGKWILYGRADSSESATALEHAISRGQERGGWANRS